MKRIEMLPPFVCSASEKKTRTLVTKFLQPAKRDENPLSPPEKPNAAKKRPSISLFSIDSLQRILPNSLYQYNLFQFIISYFKTRLHRLIQIQCTVDTCLTKTLLVKHSNVFKLLFIPIHVRNDLFCISWFLYMY